MNEEPPRTTFIKRAARFAVGVIAGMIVALLLLIAVELFSAVVHPLPEGFDGSKEEMCAHVARYPQWVLAAVVPMWGFTAWFSTWTAGKIGRRPAAIVIGLLLLAGVIINVAMLPYPIWFKPVIVLTILFAVVWAIFRSRRSQPEIIS